MAKRPKAPAHLSPEAQKLWKKVQTEYRIIDTPGLATLSVMMESWQRMQDCRKTIFETGLIGRDKSSGKITANPLLSVERDARMGFLNCLRLLNLDPEPFGDDAKKKRR